MDKRLRNIILSLLLIPLGILLIGIGYTMKMGHPVNTFVFLSGIVLVIFGVVFFIINALK